GGGGRPPAAPARGRPARAARCGHAAPRRPGGGGGHLHRAPRRRLPVAADRRVPCRPAAGGSRRLRPGPAAGGLRATASCRGPVTSWEGAPRRVILDCDPGIDDAFAIAFGCGHPGLDLAGVTTVAGNVGLDRTTANAL